MKIQILSAVVAFAVFAAGHKPENSTGLDLARPAERVDDPEPDDYELIEASSSAEAAGSFISTIDLFDKRFQVYEPPGDGDSRGPCPALNALSNHRFMSHNGKYISVIELTLGALLGIGLSPESGAVAGLVQTAFSPRIYALSFHLADLALHNRFIEHDGSFSRDNIAVGNQIDFDPYLWNISMTEMRGDVVTAFNLGRGKSARVRESFLRHPQTVWGPKAIISSGFEMGVLLACMTNWVLGVTRRSWLQVLFEQERLPYHLGWRPVPLAANGATIMALGAACLLSAPDILDTASRALLSTPSEIFQTIFPFLPPGMDLLANATSVINRLGLQNKASTWVLDSLAGLVKGGKRDTNLISKALPAMEKMSPQELETFNFATLFDLFPDDYQEFMDKVFM